MVWEVSWASLGVSWGPLGGLLGRLGCLLGCLGESLGVSRRSWGSPGAVWECFGSLLGGISGNDWKIIGKSQEIHGINRKSQEIHRKTDGKHWTFIGKQSDKHWKIHWKIIGTSLEHHRIIAYPTVFVCVFSRICGYCRGSLGILACLGVSFWSYGVFAISCGSLQSPLKHRASRSMHSQVGKGEFGRVDTR